MDKVVLYLTHCEHLGHFQSGTIWCAPVFVGVFRISLWEFLTRWVVSGQISCACRCLFAALFLCRSRCTLLGDFRFRFGGSVRCRNTFCRVLFQLRALKVFVISYCSHPTDATSSKDLSQTHIDIFVLV